MFNDLNSQKRQEYNSLKQLSPEEYSLDLISIYKLYLILKVRTRQLANHDLEIVDTQKGLEKIFYPLNWSDKEKKEISIERELPEINKNEKSSQALLPLSLLILTLSLSKIFSTSTFVMIIQLFMFLVIGSMVAKVIKGQKSDKDVDELKAWDYVVNSNFKK